MIYRVKIQRANLPDDVYTIVNVRQLHRMQSKSIKFENHHWINNDQIRPGRQLALAQRWPIVNSERLRLITFINHLIGNRQSVALFTTQLRKEKINRSIFDRFQIWNDHITVIWRLRESWAFYTWIAILTNLEGSETFREIISCSVECLFPTRCDNEDVET